MELSQSGSNVSGSIRTGGSAVVLVLSGSVAGAGFDYEARGSLGPGFSHHGDRITLEPDEPLTVKVPPAPKRPEPTQPPGRAPMRRRSLTRS
jgi:hypothetical protein